MRVCIIIKTSRGVFYSLILLLKRRSSTSTNVKLVALVIGIFFGCWCILSHTRGMGDREDSNVLSAKVELKVVDLV